MAIAEVHVPKIATVSKWEEERPLRIFNDAEIGELFILYATITDKEIARGVIIKKGPDGMGHVGEICRTQSIENCRNCIEKASCPIPALLAAGRTIQSPLDQSSES
jgi:hypothetical protein